MYETADDLARMQQIMDASYQAAGDHLLSIHEPARRLTAAEIAPRLDGMILLTLATSTADGRPLAGPVDGFLVRGDLCFGSSPDSLRFRHIEARPHVSATHLPGEHFGLTVHGTAEVLDFDDDEDSCAATLRQICLENYGPEWNEWGEGAAYARITAAKLFAFHMDPEDPAAG